MMLIGIDPHKSTHAATAVKPGTNREVASIRLDASLQEYRRMLAWAAPWPQQRWAIENAERLGRHLASWLLARGEHVVADTLNGNGNGPESDSSPVAWAQERPHRRSRSRLRGGIAG